MSMVWMNQLSWVDDEAHGSEDQPPAEKGKAMALELELGQRMAAAVTEAFP